MDVNLRNNVKVIGAGSRSIVFAHGFGCDQSMWRFITPHFDSDHKVVLFDHVGCGQSQHSAYDDQKYATLHGYAADILEICAALQLDRPILVGHSVSAMMGILASIQEPNRFSALVLITPSPCYVDSDDYRGGFSPQDIQDFLEFLDNNYIGWSRSMAKVIMGNPERPELGEELANSFCRTDPSIAKKFARVTFLSDHRQDLSQVRVPCLILQCREDPVAPVTVGEFIHRTIPGSEFVLLEATGHCPNLSAPAETVAAIRQFIDHLPPH